MKLKILAETLRGLKPAGFQRGGHDMVLIPASTLKEAADALEQSGSDLQAQADLISKLNDDAESDAMEIRKLRAWGNAIRAAVNDS